MEPLSRILETACLDKEITGAVLVAAGKSDFNYEKAFGGAWREDGSDYPYNLDTAFWLASATKLITSVAAMQCVERGQVNLDDDVTGTLPELKDIQIISGFDEGSGEPILSPSSNKITLRRLLSHSSGLGYDFSQPLLARWRQHRNEPLSLSGLPLTQRCLTPVIFESGTDWLYGTGIDWAGEMVRRVNGNISLQDYFQKNIFGPLDMRDTTFHLEQRPDIEARLSPVTKRSPDGKLAWGTHPIAFPHPTKDEYGGGGLYGTAPDYLKLLKSICFNDGNVLKPTTVDLLFAPQLSNEAQDKLNQRVEDPAMRRGYGGGTPLGIEIDAALGGVLTLQDVPGRRRAGSMSWGGLPNLKWWIDPKSQVCGFYATQLIPPADPKSIELLGVFEEHVYASAGV